MTPCKTPRMRSILLVFAHMFEGFPESSLVFVCSAKKDVIPGVHDDILGGASQVIPSSCIFMGYQVCHWEPKVLEFSL